MRRIILVVDDGEDDSMVARFVELANRQRHLTVFPGDHIERHLIIASAVLDRS